MHRFLAVSWDAHDPRASAEAARRTKHFESRGLALAARGLRVWHDWPASGPWRAWTLPLASSGESGVILGQLFERQSQAAAHGGAWPFDVASASLVVATDGRALLERFWGTYVAFLVDERHFTRCVLRSVGAGVACYRLHCGHLDVFFSDMRDLAALGIEDIALNWRYVAGFLNYSQIVRSDSALMDVSEVLAGECIRLGAGSERREMLWSPTETLANSGDGDYVADCEMSKLRSITQASINAWAAVHERVLLSLSGGFDSAVVLGCLGRSPSRPEVVCLNRFSGDAGEDERVFARAAARRAGRPLVERAWEAADVSFAARLSETPLAPKPSIQALLQIEGRGRVEEMRAAGAETCWTGEGGDHLFFQFQTSLTVADHVRQHGLSLRLGTVLSDAVRLTRQPYWQLLKLAAKAYVLRSSGSLVTPVPFERSFLSRDATATGCEAETSHPWLSALARVPPGKQLQIRALVELLHRHAPVSRLAGAPDVHPLVSLPLIECCLGIPTWVALRGGRGRALARDAFRDLVPAAIRRRESKGGTGLFLMSVVRREAVFVRELLGEGILAREGWLNLQALDAHLVRGQPLRPGQLFGLLACVAAEVWLRAFSARQRSY